MVFTQLYAKRFEPRPFKILSLFTQHMQKTHSKKTCQCIVPGCDRIGQDGYVRRAGLTMYHAIRHVDAPLPDTTQSSIWK